MSNKFCKKNSLHKVWLFFTLNKIIPFYLISEFLNVSFFILIKYFFLNLFFRVQKAFNSNSVLNLISWSSIGRTSFFLLIIVIKKNFFLWKILMIFYSIILGIILFL